MNYKLVTLIAPVVVSCLLSYLIVSLNNATLPPSIEDDKTKIFVMDMDSFVEKQLAYGNEPLQVLADSENLMKALRLQGYLVIDHASVLTFPQEYAMPEVDMVNVYAWLQQNNVPVIQPEDMENRLEMSQRAVANAYSIQ